MLGSHLNSIATMLYRNLQGNAYSVEFKVNTQGLGV